MGQYWRAVNLTKREFIDAHKLGCGLKLWEQLANHGVGRALVILTAAMPVARGGGDFDNNDDISYRTVGRWAGDRIAFVGDYAEERDLPKRFRAQNIYNLCRPKVKGDGRRGKQYTDITDDVCYVIERELDGKFVGTGWREFKQNN